MQQEPRLRTLVREELERGAAPEPRIERVLHRARRRRIGRRAGYAVLVAFLGTLLAVPLTELAWLGHNPRGVAGGTAVERFGIHAHLPQGWDSRFYLSPGRGPVLVAANFPLRSWHPTGVTFSHPLAPYVPRSLGGERGPTERW